MCHSNPSYPWEYPSPFTRTPGYGPNTSPTHSHMENPKYKNPHPLLPVCATQKTTKQAISDYRDKLNLFHMEGGICSAERVGSALFLRAAGRVEGKNKPLSRPTSEEPIHSAFVWLSEFDPTLSQSNPISPAMRSWSWS